MNQRGADGMRLAALTERAGSTLERASAAGDMPGITDAVAIFEQVEDIAGRERGPEYWISLINLANALIVQAEVGGGSDEALDRALNLLDHHEELFRDPQVRPAYLARKGRALLMKAQRTGHRPVMRRAVRVQRERQKMAPRGHAARGGIMFDLGVTLLHSGAMFSDLAELGEAIDVLASVKKRPDSCVDRAAVLSALGNARLALFLRVTRRDRAELDTALEEHREAMDELEPEKPDALIYVSDFAAVLRAHPGVCLCPGLSRGPMLAWCFVYYLDRAFVAVDSDPVTGVQSYRCVAAADDGGDAEFACHDDGMGHRSADVGDHSGGPSRRPAGAHCDAVWTVRQFKAAAAARYRSCRPAVLVASLPASLGPRQHGPPGRVRRTSPPISRVRSLGGFSVSMARRTDNRHSPHGA